MRSAWCVPISASEYIATTGRPSTRTGWRGPGTFDTFSANDRACDSTRSAKCPSGGTWASWRMHASRCWASWPCLRTLVACRMVASRSSGSAAPSGRSRQKNESRLPGPVPSWPGPAALCRLTGTFTRTAPRWPWWASSQRCSPPATTDSTPSLTVAPPVAWHTRCSPASPAVLNATDRRASICPSNGDRCHGCGASRAADHRSPSRCGPPAVAGTARCELARCALARGAAAGASSQSTALAIAIAVIPSASAWWMRQITALRPPASPGITSIRHSGRDRSRCRAKMAATAVRSPASSPDPAVPPGTT